MNYKNEIFIKIHLCKIFINHKKGSFEIDGQIYLMICLMIGNLKVVIYIQMNCILKKLFLGILSFLIKHLKLLKKPLKNVGAFFL